MKLEAKTLAVLKNYALINPSILFKEGDVISTISPSKSILAKAKVPNTFSRRCAVYELTKLLGGISIAEDPEISFDTGSVIIKDKRSVQKIPYTPEESIKTPPEKNIVLGSTAVTLSVTDADIKNVIKAAGNYGLPEIAFVGDGATLAFQAVDAKNPNSSSYSIPVGTTDKSFRVIFKVENILKLMAGDYEVVICAKPLVAHFKNADIEYWVAVETTSNFD